MPYIKYEQRAVLNGRVRGPMNVGELNYLITKLVDTYIEDVSYMKINEAIGVLECAKLELYRRIAAPYEDTKKAINGDVYDILV